MLAEAEGVFTAQSQLAGACAHKRWPDETTGEKESSWYSTGK